MTCSIMMGFEILVAILKHLHIHRLGTWALHIVLSILIRIRYYNKAKMTAPRP